MISTECVDGKYGPDCGSTCGKCKNSAACDKGNGRCPDCITGYNPPYCEGNVHSCYNYFSTKFTIMIIRSNIADSVDPRSDCKFFAISS